MFFLYFDVLFDIILNVTMFRYKVISPYLWKEMPLVIFLVNDYGKGSHVVLTLCDVLDKLVMHHSGIVNVSHGGEADP